MNDEQLSNLRKRLHANSKHELAEYCSTLISRGVGYKDIIHTVLGLVSGHADPDELWLPTASVINLSDSLVVELKNPADESADVWKAYSKLQTYKDEISDLLAYNVALVISDGITARVGSVTANKERFMPWNTIRNEDDQPLLEYQLEKVVRGFFDPELSPDCMRYFVHFEDDDDSLTKWIAGYYKFHGAPEGVRVYHDPGWEFGRWRRPRSYAGLTNDVQSGSRKAGEFLFSATKTH